MAQNVAIEAPALCMAVAARKDLPPVVAVVDRKALPLTGLVVAHKVLRPIVAVVPVRMAVMR